MKLSKRQKIILIVVITIITLLISCEEDIIFDTEKLVSEMTKMELLWSVFFVTLVTGLITS